MGVNGNKFVLGCTRVCTEQLFLFVLSNHSGVSVRPLTLFTSIFIWLKPWRAVSKKRLQKQEQFPVKWRPGCSDLYIINLPILNFGSWLSKKCTLAENFQIFSSMWSQCDVMVIVACSHWLLPSGKCVTVGVKCLMDFIMWPRSHVLPRMPWGSNSIGMNWP